MLSEYRTFIAEVDAAGERLFRIHRKYLFCRRGCAACCTNLTVLPVEAWRTTQSRGGPIRFDSEAACGFLREGACSIYPLRPLICRTHGLPLLYLVREFDGAGGEVDSEDPQWQLSFCDLNFPGISENEWGDIFSPTDVLNMEDLNSRLEQINRRFLASPEGAALSAAVLSGRYGAATREHYRGTGRIPLEAPLLAPD